MTQPDTDAVPVIAYRNGEAEDWYTVYTALTRHAVADNALGNDPEIRAARDLAFKWFNAAFEVL